MIKIILYKIFLVSILSFISAFAYSETVYVSDNLRVGVRPSPDSSIAPINVVNSGMHLIVIEREGGYIKIKTNSGVHGWVKEIYMTKDIPVREKFNTLSLKYEKLTSQIEALNKTIDNLNEVKYTLISDLDKIRTGKSEVELKLARILENQYVNNISKPSNYWIIISIVAVIIAFLFGILWYRYLVTRRLGGLRI